MQILDDNILFDKNVVIGLSCIPPCFEEKFIQDIFYKIAQCKPKNVLVMYADTLQRHAFLADNFSMDKVKKLTEQRSGTMRALLDSNVDKYFNDYKIMNWDTYLKYSGCATHFFIKIYEQVASFKIIIDQLCLAIYNKKYPPKKNIEEIRPRKLQHLRAYFFEEILASTKSIQVEEITYDALVYPVNVNDHQIKEVAQISDLFNEIDYLLKNEILPMYDDSFCGSNPIFAEALESVNHIGQKQLLEGKNTKLILISNESTFVQ